MVVRGGCGNRRTYCCIVEHNRFGVGSVLVCGGTSNDGYGNLTGLR